MEATSTLEQLEARWASSEPSPNDDGAVALIVRRPAADQREELQSAAFSCRSRPGRRRLAAPRRQS